jgi:glutathione synthase/RimK-type ligase-like ATP-grasp enzyme
MSMKHCAFLTLDTRGDFVIDDEHAIAPLEAIGWRVSTVSWRQTRMPWNEFDVVIIRSTWDYWNDVPSFLDVLARINRETRLVNSLDLVHWNLSKTYMRDLEGNGVTIVPTLWADHLQADSFGHYLDELGGDELVVKPVVGANGQDAFRVSRSDPQARLDRVAERFTRRDCMLQPFMSNIVTEGEYSLFFFNGDFSHAILKTPAENEFRSQEEHGAEIKIVTPEQQLLFRAEQAMATLSPPPLYGRIDFVRDEQADFVVMELELIEPSLYLRMDSGAPARFAQAIDHWFKRMQSRD